MADKTPKIKILPGIESQLSKLNSNGNDVSEQSNNGSGPKKRIVYNSDGSVKGIEEVNSSGETFPAYNTSPLAPLLSKERGADNTIATGPPQLGMGDVKAAEQKDVIDYSPIVLKPGGNFEINGTATPKDETNRELFNYERLNNYPLVKKEYQSKKIIPLEKYTDENGDIKLMDDEPYLGMLENKMRTDALNNINAMDIPIVRNLPDDAKLQYMGYAYQDNPFIAGLGAVLTPLIATTNLVKTGVKKLQENAWYMPVMTALTSQNPNLQKVLTTTENTIPYPQYQGSSKTNELLNFAAEVIPNLLPVMAGTKTAGWVFRGIENPVVKSVLSTALGFSLAEQPTQLDLLTQGQITPEEYGTQVAKSLGTGAVFGLSEPLFKGNFKYSIPYTAVAPSLVPVMVDVLTGKDVNYEGLLKDMAMNPLLDIGFNWSKLRNSTFANKLKESKNPYDVKIDVTFNPKTGKYEQVITHEKEMYDANGEPYTGIEKEVLQEIQGLLPYRNKNTNIEVGPNGEAVNLKNKSEPMLMKDYKDMTPEEIKTAQNRVNERFKVDTGTPEQVILSKEPSNNGNNNNAIKKEQLNNAEKQINQKGTAANDGQEQKPISEKQNSGDNGKQQVSEKVSDAQSEVSMRSEAGASERGQKADVKKPWEYTRYDYIAKNPEGITNEKSKAPIENLLMDKHEREVRKAFIAGEKVPDEVLQEYPQIVAMGKDKAELENIINGWDLKVDNAKKNIRNRGNNINLGVDPTALKDYVIVGADLLKKGVTKLVEFGRELKARYGPIITPHIKRIYDEAKAIWNGLNNRYQNVQMYLSEKDYKVMGFFGDNKSVDFSVKNGESFGAYAKRIIPMLNKKSVDMAELKNRYNIEKERLATVTTQEPPPTPPDKSGQASLKKEGDSMRSESKNNDGGFRYNENIDANINKWEKNQKDRKTARDVVKKAIKDLPDIEKNLREKGFSKYDISEKLSSEITKKVFATSEYKDMDNYGRYHVRKAIKSYFENNVESPEAIERALFNGNKKSWKYAVKEFTARALRQSTNVIARYGEPGREFVKRIQGMRNNEKIYLGKASEILFDLHKDLTKAEYNNLVEIRKAKRMASTYIPEQQRGSTAVRGLNKEQGQRKLEKEMQIPKPISEKVAQYDKRLEDYYKEMANEFKSRDFMTKNPYTGEVYFFEPRNMYEPRILKDDVDKLAVEYKMNGDGDFLLDKDGNKIPIPNKASEKVLEHLVKTGQARNKGEAEFLLNHFIEKQKKFVSGNVEFSRTIDLPSEYYKDDVGEVLLQYTSKAAKRLSYSDSFGKDSDIAEKLFNEMQSLGHDDTFARKLLRYETQSYTEGERKAIQWINNIKSYQTVTKFTPFTTFRNSVQGVLGSTTRGNLKAGLTGLIKSFTKEAQRNAYKSGALFENLNRLMNNELDSSKNTFTGKYLKIIGFDATDRWNKIIAASAGETFYKDMLSRIKNNSILKRRAYREFEKLGLNAEEVVKRGEFTERELDLIRRTFAADTQFTTTAQDLPLWWNSPLGKLTTQWKSFSFRMTKLISSSIINEAKAGNLMPLFTFLAAYGITGEGINIVIDKTRDLLNYDPKGEGKDYESPSDKMLISKIKDGDWNGFGKRLIEDYSGLGAMSFMVDFARSMGYGKSGVVGSILGPFVSETVQSVTDIFETPAKTVFNLKTDNAFKNTLKGWYDAAVRQIPGAGIIRTFGIQKLFKEKIFGADTNIKNDFYKTLNDAERREMKNIDNLESERNDIRKQFGKESNQYKEASIKIYDAKKRSELWNKYRVFKYDRDRSVINPEDD